MIMPGGQKRSNSWRALVSRALARGLREVTPLDGRRSRAGVVAVTQRMFKPAAVLPVRRRQQLELGEGAARGAQLSFGRRDERVRDAAPLVRLAYRESAYRNCLLKLSGGCMLTKLKVLWPATPATPRDRPRRRRDGWRPARDGGVMGGDPPSTPRNTPRHLATRRPAASAARQTATAARRAATHPRPRRDKPRPARDILASSRDILATRATL